MIRSSESIASLAAALVAAQADMKNAPKETKGQVGSQTRYYTDLPTLTDLVRPILAQRKLAYVQLPSGGGGGDVSLTTRLIHESGEWLEDDYAMPAGNNGAQGVGSALTYARRYALMALLGIAADDDDGAGASTTKAAAPRAEPKPKTEGQKVYDQLKLPSSEATKILLKEMAAHYELRLTATDLDASPEFRAAVKELLDGAPR